MFSVLTEVGVAHTGIPSKVIVIAKAAGKYKGRKPIQVDEAKFRATCARWRTGEITATQAITEVGLKPNTFYRRVEKLSL